MERWSVRSGELHLVVAARAAEAPAGGVPLGPSDACFRVLDWASPDAISEADLAEMVRVIEPHVQRVSDAPRSWLRSRVADGLRLGRLVAYVLPPPSLGARGAVAKAGVTSADRPPPPAEKKTWVAVRLVDDDDAPVPYKRYRIELPDGSTREGILDDRGLARIDGIDPGTCQVSFPDLDASAWKAA